ncbi:AraC family transcriptional regulator [Arvimicrobium flavum]|uniref:AraC family transcriptional regulator n=1 Tax=Arvimicrobium flavum TaxID=3393320 RepID=UPI00398C9D4E
MPPIPSSGAHDLERLHEQRLEWLEHAEGAVIALPTEYPDGFVVTPHRHSRSQLLHALHGVVMVATDAGRWIVPPDHAMWIPAHVEHSVDMLGSVSMRSIYIVPDAVGGSSSALRVVAITDLMRALIVELSKSARAGGKGGEREALLTELLLLEIPNLPELPLALPFPTEARMAALCRTFVQNPSSRATIEDWADRLGMSRRSFTRAFLRETGLSLSTWRQQACLFAALPRLAEGQPVTRVALDLGYDSAPAFTTMFRRMMGVSPRSYLQKSAQP